MYVIGEWVRRRIGGEAGVVIGIETCEGVFLYRVRLMREDVPEEQNVVLGTDDAWEPYHRIHAHVESAVADCDGPMERTQVVRLIPDERKSYFGDLEFRERVVIGTVSLSGHGDLSVTPEWVVWHEATEEGYRHVEITWCTDECEDEYRQRDVYAEQMGY